MNYREVRYIFVALFSFFSVDRHTMPPSSSVQTCTRSWFPLNLHEFHFERLLPSITAGIVMGVFVIFVRLSFAALIFSGNLSPYIANGIGFLLSGSAVIGIVIALMSSYSGMIATVQDSPTVIIALVVAAIAHSLTNSMPPETIYITVVISISLTTFLTGLFFWFMGYFELGNLVRFIPYPVVGGFLAGTGWLLTKGGIGVMTGSPVNYASFVNLFQNPLLLKWVPAACLGGVLILALRRFAHFLTMPFILFSAIGLFYLFLFITQTSISDAISQGWFLGPFPEGRLWQPIPIHSINQVQWLAILKQAGNISTVLLVSLISLLLNAGGIELAIRQDVDLNRELRSAGIANLLMGFCGCPPGYHTLSLTILGFKLGSRNCLSLIIASLMCIGILFFGTSLLSYFPKFIVGGLLFFLGLVFLTEWLYDAWFSLPTVDYLLILLILGVVGTLGFLEGVILGVFVALILFVIKYSHINVIKHVLSGVNYRSNVDRAMPFQRILHEKGKQLLICQLQGFLFFGTAQNLLKQIRLFMADIKSEPLRFLLIDFQLVTGLDSSSIQSFQKMKQIAENQKMVLVFVSISSQIHRQLELGGLIEKDDLILRIFPDLDHGLEWCEEQILQSAKPDHDQARQQFLDTSFDDIMKILEKQELFETIVAELMPYLEQQRVEKGTYLIHQGDPPDALYFIESGKVTQQLDRTNGNPIRLRTQNFGTVVGELGFYLEQNASVSVVVQEPGIIYRLSIQALQQMTEDNPRLAAHFHQFIANHMGQQLSNTIKTMQELMT